MKRLQRLTVLSLFCSSVSILSADIRGPGELGRVEKLIQRLGADHYALRQQAREELKQIGYPAFDHLLQAQYADDAEVSLAARQLISQFTVKWIQAQDPPVIGYAFRDYQRLAADLRVRRGAWLAELEDGLGTYAVFRIVRYEPAEVVAKQVALAFLENFDETDPLRYEALDAAFKNVLGNAERQPARWLSVFRADLTESDDFDRLTVWKQLVDEEIQLVNSARSNKVVASALAEWYAGRVIRLGELDRVKQVLPQLIELRTGNAYLTLRTAEWLLDHGLIGLFNIFRQTLQEADTVHPGFAYCVAESFQRQGKQEEAARAAEEAFLLTEKDEKYMDPLWTTDERFRAAVKLEQRGLTEWSLREYNRIIEQPIVHWLIADRRERSIKLMAELLHDGSRDREAADTLAKLVKEEATTAFPDDDLDDETAGIISRMYYFRSEQFRREGDRQKQIEFLRKAKKTDPTDADVLIAMYRLPRADKEWQSTTKQLIEEAVQLFEEKLQRLRSNGIVANRGEIAMQLNQIAWLVGNTEGNQRKAIQQSRRSLELQPKSAGSLDTLARTYFAVGDFENALKYQRRAVKLLPHSLQIRNQLSEFERHAAVQQGAP